MASDFEITSCSKIFAREIQPYSVNSDSRREEWAEKQKKFTPSSLHPSYKSFLRSHRQQSPLVFTDRITHADTPAYKRSWEMFLAGYTTTNKIRVLFHLVRLVALSGIEGFAPVSLENLFFSLVLTWSVQGTASLWDFHDILVYFLSLYDYFNYTRPPWPVLPYKQYCSYTIVLTVSLSQPVGSTICLEDILCFSQDGLNSKEIENKLFFLQTLIFLFKILLINRLLSRTVKLSTVSSNWQK